MTFLLPPGIKGLRKINASIIQETHKKHFQEKIETISHDTRKREINAYFFVK